jgi:hypothetical protein
MKVFVLIQVEVLHIFVYVLIQVQDSKSYVRIFVSVLINTSRSLWFGPFNRFLLYNLERACD